jgi:hypothetical protein
VAAEKSRDEADSYLRFTTRLVHRVELRRVHQARVSPVQFQIITTLICEAEQHRRRLGAQIEPRAICDQSRDVVCQSRSPSVDFGDGLIKRR